MTLKTSEKKGICGICSAGCWIIADYDDKGNIINIRPDESSPMGITCKLGDHAADIIYSEHRIKTPLKRKGPKGTYDFEPVTWDEAFDIIVKQLNDQKAQYGPESAAIYTGVGSFELAYCDIFQPADVLVSSASSVLFPYGSPNTMGVGALCYVSYGMIAPHVTFGKILTEMYNDIENSDLVVVWGTNPATDLPPIDMKKIIEAKQRGASVVVIDPRKTATAQMTDAQWIPIRPGTDGALALGLCNVIIAEELYDYEFVENWTHGFEEFSRHVQHYRPEVVETITGIPGETVVDFARELAAAQGASQLMYTGMEYSATGVQGIRATLVLWGLAGQLDVPGGRCFLMPNNAFPINKSKLLKNPGNPDERIGGDRFPIYIRYRDEAHAIDLPKSVLNGDPYKIRSLIIQGGSIITSWPNTELWKQTLNELDFLVTIDRQLTADAAYADIILPACTYFEIESYMVYGSLFKIRERLIKPVGEARSDVFILSELAQRLGYGDLFPQSEEEMLNHVLEGSGFTLDEVRKNNGEVSRGTKMMEFKKWEKGLLRKDGKPGFDTPTGKFEIHSSILEEYGYEPLPVYTEPCESPQSKPDLLKKYPLVFNSGARVRTSFHTQHHGIESLNRERSEPTVTLNIKDAEARGIKHGDMAVIETLRGKATMRAYVTENIAQGCIDANHGCGSPVGPKAWRDTNINALTDLNQYDPISGFPVYKCLLCEVTKAERLTSRTVLHSGEVSPEELNLTDIKEPERYVYLDYNASAPVYDEVKKVVLETLHLHGNPSSLHLPGRKAHKALDRSRRIIAASLNTTPRRIIFTASGTEGNNMAVKGVALFKEGSGKNIITSSIEHPAVLETCRSLEKYSYEIRILPVNQYGVVEPETLKNAIDKNTMLVSIMMANNETGAIQPVNELCQITKNAGALFHCDAVQAYGKIPVDVKALDVDMLTISSHKIGGPRGCGVLYIKKGISPEPLISGGGHEMGFRSGTENLSAIAGFAKAVEINKQQISSREKVKALSDKLYDGIKDVTPSCFINGPIHNRLPNTLNVTIPGFRGESIVLHMDRLGVSFSAGSACKSGSAQPSHALLAMGLSAEKAHCAVRFSLGPSTTEEDIVYTLDIFKKMLEESRNIIQFVPCR